jgi:transposase
MRRIKPETVEHPFGTITAWTCATHFLTRPIDRVAKEISLNVLAYNMKRMLERLGSEPVMTTMQA